MSAAELREKLNRIVQLTTEAVEDASRGDYHEGAGALNSNSGAVVNASPHKPHPGQGSTARRYFDLPNAQLRPTVFAPSRNQPTARFARTATPTLLHLSGFIQPSYRRRERCV